MSYFLSLPPEVLQEIFKHSSVKDLKNLACCNSFCNVVLKTTMWRSVDIPCIYLNSLQLSSKWSKLNNLQFTKYLCLHTDCGDHNNDATNGYTPSEFVESLLPFSNFVCILAHCNCRILNSLSIDLLYFAPDSHNQYLCIICEDLSRLKSLTVLNSKVTDSALTQLRKLKYLEKLYLDSSSDISDDGVSHVSSLVRLQEFNLSSYHGNDNEYDRFVHRPVTDVGVSGLLRLADLRLLNLSFTGITDVSLILVSKLRHVETLDVGETEVSDVGIRHLQHLRKLRELGLFGCWKITNLTLTYVKKMVNLEFLDIMATDVTDVGLIHLCSLTRLRELRIGFNEITDLALPHLINIVNLETVNICYTKVTNVGIQLLSSVKTLQGLDMCSSDLGGPDAHDGQLVFNMYCKHIETALEITLSDQ